MSEYNVNGRTPHVVRFKIRRKVFSGVQFHTADSVPTFDGDCDAVLIEKTQMTEAEWVAYVSR